MRVLSLDLDLFSSPIILRGDDDVRPPDEGATVLSEAEIRSFLEGPCGLDRQNPIRGAVVRSHHEVASLWGQLVDAGYLRPPFDLCHADAHDDLGVDGEDDAFNYLCNETLLLPVEERRLATGSRCNAGNFLSYVIAYRWVRSIEFVIHPECDQMMPLQFLTRDGRAIQLEPLCVSDEAASRYPRYPEGNEVDEPVVEFVRTAMCDFRRATDFEFVFVSQSPGFVPPMGDWMVEVAREYVEPLPSN